jgi:hypothetical protein
MTDRHAKRVSKNIRNWAYRARGGARSGDYRKNVDRMIFLTIIFLLCISLVADSNVVDFPYTTVDESDDSCSRSWSTNATSDRRGTQAAAAG